MSVSFRLDAESPIWRKRAGLATEGRLPFVQPLSLTPFDSSPKGGALGMSVSFRLDAESPTGRKSAGLATEGSSFWTMHLVKLPLA